MKFGKWEENIHSDVEQIKRIASAQHISSGKVSVDPDSETANIAGSDGVYSVTLDSCTCFDFQSRHLPCKHIYRLAYDLGYLNDLPVLDKNAAKDFNSNALQNDVEHYKQLYFDGIISIDKFCKIANALLSK